MGSPGSDPAYVLAGRAADRGGLGGGGLLLGRLVDRLGRDLQARLVDRADPVGGGIRGGGVDGGLDRLGVVGLDRLLLDRVRTRRVGRDDGVGGRHRRGGVGGRAGRVVVRLRGRRGRAVRLGARAAREQLAHALALDVGAGGHCGEGAADEQEPAE